MPATGASLGIERLLMMLPGSADSRRRRLDVAVTVLGDDLAPQSFALAAAARAAGLRASNYLGASAKLGVALGDRHADVVEIAARQLTEAAALRRAMRLLGQIVKNLFADGPDPSDEGVRRSGGMAG